MFCVRCGREGAVVEGVCADCFRTTQVLARLPATVRVETCARCGSRHRRGSWGPPGVKIEAAIEEEVRGEVDVDPRVATWHLRLDGGKRDPTNYSYEVVVDGVALGVAFEVRQPLVVHVQSSTCTRCGRRTGGYYESVVQLRSEERKLDEEHRKEAVAIADRCLASFEAAGDHDSFLSKAKDVQGGADLYLGTVHAGRAIAKALSQELGATLKETATLVGRGADGVDIYRVTLLARLPRARAGDFVAWEGRLHEVTRVGPREVGMVDLDRAEHVRVPREDLEKAHVVPRGEAVEAVVVSASEDELQLLDPVTLATVDVLRPPGFGGSPAVVRVVRWEGRLWLAQPKAR